MSQPRPVLSVSGVGQSVYLLQVPYIFKNGRSVCPVNICPNPWAQSMSKLQSVLSVSSVGQSVCLLNMHYTFKNTSVYLDHNV